MGPILGLLFVLLFSLNAFSAEGPSLISFKEIYLQETIRAAEQTQGGFDPFQWKLGVEGKLQSDLQVNMSIGQTALLYRPNWITASGGETVSLLEAQVLFKTSVVDIYAGQTLIPWGEEGSKEENELFIPRSFLYEKGLLPLRDLGAGVIARYEGLYFDIFAHSGEGGGYQQAGDNRLFVTGQWGYETPTEDRFGVSVTGGRYLSAASLSETRLKGGNMFFGLHIFSAYLEAEASYFQSFVTTAGATTQTDLMAWHGDLQLPASENVNLLYRYEQYNPNLKVASNILGRGYFGVEWHSRNSFSRFFIFLVKNNESLQETPNDELRLTWRITNL
jgi:hypothetical protein